MLTPNNNFHALLFRLTRSSSRYLSISFGTRVPNWSKRLETGVGDKVSGHRVRVKLAMMWTETRLLDYAANESLQYHFLSKAITSGPRVAINIYKHFFLANSPTLNEADAEINLSFYCWRVRGRSTLRTSRRQLCDTSRFETLMSGLNNKLLWINNDLWGIRLHVRPHSAMLWDKLVHKCLHSPLSCAKMRFQLVIRALWMFHHPSKTKILQRMTESYRRLENVFKTSTFVFCARDCRRFTTISWEFVTRHLELPLAVTGYSIEDWEMQIRRNEKKTGIS